MAEWLGKALQKLLQRFESARDLKNRPDILSGRFLINSNMNAKIIQWAGILACLTLIVSCFVPWTFHADVGKNFTGFFSEKNQYGRPGKFLIIFSVVSLALIVVPKIWAKRINLFLTAFTAAYAIKTYILYTSCYNAYCPEKKAGIYIMLFSTVIILVAAVFPNMKIMTNKDEGVK